MGFEGQTDIGAIAERMTGIARTYAPDPARKALYDDLFAVYKTLHPSLRDTFAALARFRQKLVCSQHSESCFRDFSSPQSTVAHCGRVESPAQQFSGKPDTPG